MPVVILKGLEREKEGFNEQVTLEQRSEGDEGEWGGTFKRPCPQGPSGSGTLLLHLVPPPR